MESRRACHQGRANYDSKGLGRLPLPPGLVFDKQQLPMVRSRIALQADWTKFDRRMMDLQVFEADLQKGRWSEIKGLGRQVLVLGQTVSRALAVGGLLDQMFQGNHVFLLGDDWARFHPTCPWCNCSDCRKPGYKYPSYCVST